MYGEGAPNASRRYRNNVTVVGNNETGARYLTGSGLQPLARLVSLDLSFIGGAFGADIAIPVTDVQGLRDKWVHSENADFADGNRFIPWENHQLVTRKIHQILGK